MNKKHLTAALALTMLTSSVSPTLSFAKTTDNPKVNWLVEQRWVLGRDGGDLALDSTIQRSEFVKMILAAQGLLGEAEAKKDNESKFKDVDKSHWANGIINLAAEKGLVKGDDNGNFRPDDKISYNEILTILSRLNPSFKDDLSAGSNWADQYIKFAKNNGYLKDVKVEEKDFAKDATREKTFEIIYNYYHALKPINASSVTNDNTKRFTWPIWTILGSDSSRTPIRPTTDITKPVIPAPTPTPSETPLEKVKRELTNEITSAENKKKGVVVSVDGNNITKDKLWATKENIEKYNKAIEEARKALKDTKKTKETLEKALKELTTAKDEFKPAYGKMDSKSLESAIDTAENKKKDVVQSPDGNEVPTDKKWVTPESQKALDDAIASAKKVKEGAKNQKDYEEALKSLIKSIDAYTPKYGYMDKTNLNNLIAQAEKIKQNVKVSVDGKDILKGQKWVNHEALNNLNRSIENAKKANDKPSIEKAEEELNKSIELFNSSKKDGQKVELKYNVKFVVDPKKGSVNDNSKLSQSVKENTSVISIVPTVQGNENFTFRGWNPNLTDKVTFDITYTAQFEGFNIDRGIGYIQMRDISYPGATHFKYELPFNNVYMDMTEPDEYFSLLDEKDNYIGFADVTKKVKLVYYNKVNDNYIKVDEKEYNIDDFNTGGK